MAGCRRCPRLAEHREAVARAKRRAYRDETYWGAPVPGFGDPDAAIVLVGLAPGAHGSNRTGRMFTGDASGDFLYPALHRAGLASTPSARARDDGLRLRGVWITAAARCAPPGNAPTTLELDACRPWLAFDLDALPGARVLLALGKVAHDAVLKHYRARGMQATLAAHPFAHGRLHRLERLPGAEAAGALPLLDAYHVSFQNTNTGRLTETMFDAVLARAQDLAALA
ncbi:MAG: uracil-DNA glycosylase [Trueperaceae bacterium]|nr:MAG: uracil-DNA glycosylase [Trueperaceae bacterium]